MTDENINPEPQKNLAEQLDPNEIQSVSSNGVSVTMKNAADKKAELELEAAKSYNPLSCLVRLDKWSSMSK